MSFALSSIVRTRQKKTFFSLFFLILLFFPLLTPSGLVLDVSHPSSASPNVAGSAASEEDNIDSMDVHPINRWANLKDDGYTSIVSNSLLNLSDTGDTTSDQYEMDRPLRDLDGTIEVRFKTDTNSSGSAGDFLLLLSNDAEDKTYFFHLAASRDDDYYLFTRLRYTSSEGNVILTLTGDERVFDNLWYIFRLDYDILSSTIRSRLFFDNGSKVFDYSIFELGSDHRPSIFSTPELFVRIQVFCQDAGKYDEVLLDYVNAPFKEREWLQTTASLDVDWLWSTPTGDYVQDNIAEEFGQWKLTVPRLDAMSGTLQIVFEDQTAVAQDDDLSYDFYLIGVDGDDGDTHTICYIRVRHFVDAVLRRNYIQIYDGNDVLLWTAVWSGIVLESVAADFAISLNEDRSEVAIKVRGYKDFKGSVYKDGIVNLAVASFVTDPSQEFIVSTFADIFAFTGDTEAALQVIGLDLLERDIFADIGNIIDDIIGVGQDIVGGGVDVFTAIFRWVVSVITDFLGIMIDLLLGGLDALATLLDTVISTLNSVITELQGLAADIATAIWSGIEVTLDFLFDAIDGIWTALIAILDDIIAGLILLAEEAADFIFAALEFVVVLLLDILSELWDIIEGMIFFVWDALNLPNVIEIFDLTLAYIVELVQWLVTVIGDVIQLAADLSWIVLVVWWIWAVPVQWARANGNPLAGLGNFIEVYFYDLIPWTIFGIHVYVPQGIVATLWMILLLPETFILFTALGL